MTEQQKKFLDHHVFDEGERTSSKATPEGTLLRMKQKFDSNDYLPLATIKSYFSRRAKKVRLGEVTVSDDIEEFDEADETNETEEQELERENTVAGIKHGVMNEPNLLVDEWIAVAFPRGWYPGQFINYDEDNCEVYINFFERTSVNSTKFVWPMLSQKMEEDKSWVQEG